MVQKEPVRSAAPQVIGVSAKNGAVILNATAANSTTSPVALTFANDHHTDSTAHSVGAISVNPNYKTWTADQNIGSTPDAILNAVPTTYTSGSETYTIPNAWKVQPGETATDLANGNTATVTAVSITSPNSPASGVVTLSRSLTFTTNDTLQFTGCGYPGINTSSATPWLGNCAATAYFFGDAGPNADNQIVQGGMIFSLDDHGHRRGLGGGHWLDAHLSQLALANGSGTGARLDPTSYGATFEDSARIDINDLSMQGSSNSLYTNSDVGGITDGIGLVNPIFATSPTGKMAIQTGAGSTTVLSIVEAKGRSPGVAFFSQGQLSATLEANNLPSVQPVYGQDATTDAMTSTTGCGNTFASGPQCQLAKGQYTVAADSTINTASTINAAAAGSLSSSGWSLNSGASGAAAVTVAPNKSSINTGLGGTAGNMSVIIAGNEDVRHDSSHHMTFNGTTPSIVAPTGSIIVGNDTVGRITIGGGTAANNITLSFAASWANYPICRAIDETTPAVNPIYISALNTGLVTFHVSSTTNFTNGDSVSYMCMGYR